MSYFEKPIDFNSRESMRDFLLNHFRYFTASSWNQSTSWANNIKIHNLNLSDADISDSDALDFLFADHPVYDFDVECLINEFTDETGWSAGFNGRSDGYLVLYDTVWKDNKRVALPFRSVDSDVKDNIEDWSDDFLRTQAELVQRFDKLCDDIRDVFISYIKKSKVRRIKYLKPEPKDVSLIFDDENPVLENVPDFEIIVRYDSRCQNYIAEIPELENCTAEGNTVEECVYFAEKAILDWIDEAEKKGIPVPEPKGD